MKVYCNVDLVGRSDEQIEFVHFLPISQSVLDFKEVVGFLKKVKLESPDILLIFNANFFYLLVCFFYKSLNSKSVVVFFDVLLKKPAGSKQKLVASLKKRMLRCVDYFFSVHRDLSEYEKYYGISDSRSRYVAFKSNNYEIRDRYDINDNGYILSCGVSHRDYKTLFTAVRDLNVKVKVVLPDSKSINFHKSIIDFDDVPNNVEIVRHDFNKDSWNSILSQAAFVVIPIAEESIQPSGISVYLESMLFRKPVVISEGASTKGLIDKGQALIVERGSSSAMRNAIQRLLDDENLKKQYAEAGYEYAIKLQGVDRLVNDIKSELLDLN